MFVRQVKRKCSVRGCKSTDCFAISRTREVGNTVIICKSCLGKSLGAIDEINPKTKSNISAIDNTSAPALFFNAKALGTGAKATVVDERHPTDAYKGEEESERELENNISSADADEKESENEMRGGEYKCSNCDKVFKTEKGLKQHLKLCKIREGEDLQ